MSKTAIFFSPEGGNVDSVAHKLGELIGNDKADIFPVKEVEKDLLNKYNKIILVGSTVGADHWSNEIVVDEWPEFFTKNEEIGFEDKKLASVGLGNSVLDREHFADGMADIYDRIKQQNGEILGKADAKDYDFTDSEALDDEGFFCGLAIDEDNEAELTTERLEKWISIETQEISGTKYIHLSQKVNLAYMDRSLAELKLKFEGIAVGLLVTAGPDVGVVEWTIDKGPAKRLDQFTEWSEGLHIPWAYMLETELEPGEHTLILRTTDEKNEKSTGHACRIIQFLVNGP